MSVVVAPEKNGVGAFPPDGELPYVPSGIAEDAIVERVRSARVEMDDHSIGGDAIGRDAEADAFAPAIIRGDPERLPFERDVYLRRRKDADKEQDREKQHRFFLRSSCMLALEPTRGDGTDEEQCSASMRFRRTASEEDLEKLPKGG
jgi:hypothetical protein